MDTWLLITSHMIELGLMLMAFFTYRLDRRKDAADRSTARETILREQITVHTEVKYRLDALAEFHKTQLEINIMRDGQVAELAKQTALLTQAMASLDRRLQIQEDRARNER